MTIKYTNEKSPEGQIYLWDEFPWFLLVFVCRCFFLLLLMGKKNGVKIFIILRNLKKEDKNGKSSEITKTQAFLQIKVFNFFVIYSVFVFSYCFALTLWTSQ